MVGYYNSETELSASSLQVRHVKRENYIVKHCELSDFPKNYKSLLGTTRTVHNDVSLYEIY